MTAPQIDLFMSPREFFHGKIKDASRHLKVTLDEHVEFYLAANSHADVSVALSEKKLVKTTTQR